MPVRFCLDCRALTSNGSRCANCQNKMAMRLGHRRGSSAARGYGRTWRQISAEVITEHRARFGDVCPGWQRPPHPAKDLTGDHIVPKDKGGTDERSNVQVLCRACNSAKGRGTAGSGGRSPP